MAYIKRIVCLANSFKMGGSCVAGKEMLPDGMGGWIRPVRGRETAEVRPEECRLIDRALPKTLDILDVPLLRAAPCGHQTENHLIDLARRWNKVGALDWSARRHFGPMAATQRVERITASARSGRRCSKIR
jgi:hypothetical protein